MSFKTIQCFFTDTLGLNVSTGFLVKQVGKVNDALKAPYEHLVDNLPKAEHLHSDETGGKENGEGRWIWCFRGKDCGLRSDGVSYRSLEKQRGA